MSLSKAKGLNNNQSSPKVWETVRNRLNVCETLLNTKMKTPVANNLTVENMCTLHRHKATQ